MKPRLLVGFTGAIVLAFVNTAYALPSNMCEVAWTWGGIWATIGIFSGC